MMVHFNDALLSAIFIAQSGFNIWLAKQIIRIDKNTVVINARLSLYVDYLRGKKIQWSNLEKHTPL